MGKVRRMSRRPRQICRECHSDAIITKTERLDKNLSRFYCRCKNPDCCHEWVANLEYSHIIRSSKLTEKGLLYYLLERMPPEERQQLRQVLDDTDVKTR